MVFLRTMIFIVQFSIHTLSQNTQARAFREVSLDLVSQSVEVFFLSQVRFKYTTTSSESESYSRSRHG